MEKLKIYENTDMEKYLKNDQEACFIDIEKIKGYLRCKWLSKINKIVIIKSTFFKTVHQKT